MRRVYKYMLAALVAVAVSGCIENDIPYPVIKLDILSFEAEGLKSPAVINTTEQRVSLELLETTDPRRVSVTGVSVSEGAQSDVSFPGLFDLRAPLYVTLSMYQEYEWVVTATQHIERYFHVEGQIGDSEIDVVNHIATAYVPMDTDMNNIKVTAIKLGPEEVTSYTPDPFSFTSYENTVHNVTVSYYGDIEEMWTLRVIPTEVEVEFTAVDAWAKRIWVYAMGRSDADLGFKYRPTGTEEWLPVNEITIDGGNFSACIEGLEPLTSYDVVAYSGENFTNVETVTTEDTFMLLNAGFEDWSVYDGCYYPYAEGATPFWGTGNDGAKIASTTLTEPIEDVRPGSTGRYAASLQSKKAAVMGIGKFAAGNLFVGAFGGLNGMDGLVHFGRPCTARPVALRGWVKYNCGAIDEIGRVPSSRPDIKKGEHDEGQIFIAVGDWTAAEYGGTDECPVEINTKDESTFFNRFGPNVIGSGELLFDSSTDGWVEFTVPLEYFSTSRIPTHIIVVFTSSRYGDYFTGSTGSSMRVDDIELVY